MSILQFLRIFWARRFLIIATTVTCALGAFIATKLIPPQWEGTAKVMMNTLKPDPVTGEILGQSANVYIATQIELIKDATVADRVVDQLGWRTDPNLISAYQHRGRKDQRDFSQWLSQLVIDRTKPSVPAGSNILEIKYNATSPQQAQLGAETLRKAYLEASLDLSRADALRNADWFGAQAAKAKADLDAAEAEKANYEKSNGIVMEDNQTDVDTARLRVFASQGASAAPTITPQVSSAASVQLAQLDAQIAEEGKVLGPNHPQLQALKTQRETVAALVAKDQAAIKSANAAAIGAQTRAVESAIDAQKSRVIAKSDKLQQLAELQSIVELKKDLYAKTSARQAQFQQQAAEADTGLHPLGAAVTPQSPKFPNTAMIYPGSVVLGGVLGVLVALLAEFLGRRVRGVADLQSAIDAPVLAVIGAPAKPGGRVRLAAPKFRFRPSWASTKTSGAFKI
jgi:uncharacterized protein involved in exopolysaccharide biosynthesis